jgi:hypothetical protein
MSESPPDPGHPDAASSRRELPFPAAPAGGRDRDQSGRPRNSRRRDELGRPLPRDSARTGSRPGLHAQPGGGNPGSAGSPGEPASPVGPASPADAASAGGTLLLEGRPFHAHEVFEDAWKAAEGPERDLWRGLAQVAVGLTHARRGNPRGAVSLLRRGAERLRDFAASAVAPIAPVPYGIDVAHVASRADDLAAHIERDGLAALPSDAFLMSLRPG